MRRKASDLKPYGSRNVVISGKHQVDYYGEKNLINLLVFYLSKLLLDVLRSKSKTLKTLSPLSKYLSTYLASYNQVSHGTDCLSNNLSNGLST
jgi:hypothetical protein